MHLTTLRPPAPPSRHLHALWWTLAALACVVAWDAAGQDLPAAHLFGLGTGFPLRDHWLLVQVLHEGARYLAWLLALVLTLGVWWPQGILRRLDVAGRLQIVASALLALAVVSMVKNLSHTSCPWDLAEFGGVARYASHWALGTLDGGSGRCFPAGHASAGFAFLGGYFALRRTAPGAARWWLGTAVAAGFVLGGAQQMRGAHFMSHTLWTGWLCWTTGWACDLAADALRPRLAPRTGERLAATPAP
ncbi:phosphatase PAP2 family protein [Acidovorax sp. sic0104]|uniref:phosphatase PAP2 family protein n=1 Tax=Acidovorax sp. sic0104 TaxID=2854784 RepID=UPI001C44D7F1|nr:phosphatase PAP2 family protein [Acidovorax sp. sic0104]MBV7541408.1 phosphatase PAP2 family protein [Acidovorax sp. sic0104]